MRLIDHFFFTSTELQETEDKMQYSVLVLPEISVITDRKYYRIIICNKRLVKSVRNKEAQKQ